MRDHTAVRMRQTRKEGSVLASVGFFFRGSKWVKLLQPPLVSCGMTSTSKRPHQQIGHIAGAGTSMCRSSIEMPSRSNHLTRHLEIRRRKHGLPQGARSTPPQVKNCQCGCFRASPECDAKGTRCVGVLCIRI